MIDNENIELLDAPPNHQEHVVAYSSSESTDHHSEEAADNGESLTRPPSALRWKRMLDLTIIILAFPIIVPLMLLIAILIWVVSGWPIIFRQERIGFLGKRFMCFKFRTMHVGNDSLTHQKHLAQLMASSRPMVKMDSAGDPRIIPFGRILRASGLDELPQIVNVLRGDMSLVGPRPCVPYEYDHYLAWQKERFNALPGLTGLWQVSGKNKTTFEQMIRLDIRYARNPTFGGDVAILFKTMPVLANQLFEKAGSRPARAEGEKVLVGNAVVAKSLSAN